MSKSIPFWAAIILVAMMFAFRTSTDAPAADDAPSAETDEHLELRYARTWLELTEARLNRVRDANRRVSGAYPGAVVIEHERMVTSAKAQLEEALADDANPEYATYLRDAQNALSAATVEWRQAEAINEHTPGSFRSTTMEILRLRVELARLMLEKGRAAAVQSRETQVDWQLTQLRHEVFRLRDEVAKNQSGRYVRRYRYID